MPRNVVFGYTFAGMAATSYAIASILIRFAVLTQASSWVGAVISVTFGTALIAVIELRTFDNSVLHKLRPFWLLVGAGVASAVAVLCSYSAWGLAPAATVAPFVNLQPLFTALIAHVLLGGMERITPRLGLALVMATIGAALIVTSA